MHRFAALYDAIDATTATQAKVDALARYFADAPPADAAWAVAFLTGRRPKRVVRAPDLRRWAAEAAGIPDWLFEEAYAQAGDLAETVALLVPHDIVPRPAGNAAIEADVAGQRVPDDGALPGDAAGDALGDMPGDVPGDVPGDAADDVAGDMKGEATRGSLAWWVERQLLPMGAMPPDAQREALRAAWRMLHGTARFVFTKLLTGGFRVGVSDGLVVRALAATSGLSAEVIAHRLTGQWTPSAAWFTQLVHADATDADWTRPYPFLLAYPVEGDVAALGDVAAWQAEWKWDGIRAQLVRRAGGVVLWSRGEELLAGRFPEVEAAAAALPDGTVLDGELLAWQGDGPLPFAALQRRIMRRTVGAKLLAEVPVRLVAYDCLEDGGRDVRAEPLAQRRVRLERLLERMTASTSSGPSSGTSSGTWSGTSPAASSPASTAARARGPRSGAATVVASPIMPSPLVPVATWDDAPALRDAARARGAEGLMLKRRASAYGVGRKAGDWHKWKVAPLSVDAVLVYAQAGHGRRAGLYTDYTFAVWDGDALVPFAKAYSGLTDAELRQVDRFIRAHTREKFGPVRTVDPELVFEVAFEGIQPSPRHKSGVAVRFPRIARWRRDKPAREADTLATVRALLPAPGAR